ncbi:hypothetical protein [Aliivibrio fischeri]|uniref:hypothetical protein n=1 Tax=Aliivibrio fischeri TaxID=668 RepID=UPI001F15EA38|nr:hypothetical protein [Aliivibrio fischeri]MCE4937553.1 hypothetical protein [Aliivibrio fischeri]
MEVIILPIAIIAIYLFLTSAYAKPVGKSVKESVEKTASSGKEKVGGGIFNGISKVSEAIETGKLKAREKSDIKE